jgi:negative regulator of flagellin synthesis FlgM
MRIRDAYTKLDTPVRADGPKSAEAGARAKEAGRAAAGSAAAGSTSVTLSARAQELSATSESSAARVSALREQLKNGTFRVDAQAIAQKLVGDDA